MVGEDWDNWKRLRPQDDRAGPGQRDHLPDGAAVQHGLLEGAEGDRPGRAGAGRSPTGRPSGPGCEYAFDELAKAGYDGVERLHGGARTRRRREFVYRDSLWHGADMFGTGVASFGHVNGVHIQNVDTWEQYVEKLDRGELPLGRALPVTAARAADPRDDPAAEDRPARRALLPRQVRRGHPDASSPTAFDKLAGARAG